MCVCVRVCVPAPEWGKKDGRKPLPAKVCTSIIDGLKQIYFQKVGHVRGCWVGA